MESTISWLARQTPDGTWHPGFTFNAWAGCYIKSQGCKFCYAKNLPPKMRRGAVWGRNEPREVAPDPYWENPRAWARQAKRLGIRLPVFCQSTSDLFELHAVPAENERLNAARTRLWRLIEDTPELDWLLLTKEPENILDMVPAAWVRDGFPPNVWMGCTVENQENVARVEHLLRVPAVVRFLSVEPMLGPVRLVAADGAPLLTRYQPATAAWQTVQPNGLWRAWHGIDWVLCGGESGRADGVRPMHPDWARSLRDQCTAAGVAFHFKQHGEWIAEDQMNHLPDAGSHRGHVFLETYDPLFEGAEPEGYSAFRVGKHAAGRLLDGRTWDQLPLVRQ